MSFVFSDGSEFSGVSVKDLVKAIGESRANGNGVTPPDTPKRSISPRAGYLSPKHASRSSSPVAIPRKFVRVFVFIVRLLLFYF